MGEVDSLKEVLKESFSKIREDIKKMTSELSGVKKENKELRERINTLEKTRQKASLKSEIMSKFDKNKKSVIKQKIIELIQFKKAPISEIKDIIVDQQKYCSKASFYRYVEELKRTGKVNSVTVNEREVYI